MAGPKREVTREREKLAWELRTQSLTQAEIALAIEEAGLGRITGQAVGRMLRKIEARVLAELTERVKTEKAVQHESIERLKRVAWQEWDRSRRNAVMVRTKTTMLEADQGRGKVELPAEEVTRTVKGRLGDPRYLDAIIKANARQARLWGLDATPSDPPADAGQADPDAARRALLAADDPGYMPADAQDEDESTDSDGV